MAGKNSSARMEEIKLRVQYADQHGDEAALSHFALKEDTLRRYRNKVAEVERDEDYKEYRAIFDKCAPKPWTDHPQIYGDTLILNDIHLPFVDIGLLEKALRVARLLNIKQLVILGDLIDFESVAKFDFGGEQYTLMEELHIARDYFKEFEKQFDRIVFIRGNHDERAIKTLKKIKHILETSLKATEYSAYQAILGIDVSDTPWHQYKRFFESDKVEVSNHAKCEFEGKYIGLHPSNYSRNPPTVEKAFAHKYHKHIIGTHAHTSALGFDTSGDYICIQLGGLVDSDLVFYKNMRETTHPEWVPAFGWIKNKKLGYYIQHPDLFQIDDYMAMAQAKS
jgi:predicted phosphodiesterase